MIARCSPIFSFDESPMRKTMTRKTMKRTKWTRMMTKNMTKPTTATRSEPVLDLLVGARVPTVTFLMEFRAETSMK
jgi:hypothetical protein